MSGGPHELLQPAGWRPPVGYANGVAARGRCLFVAGQVGSPTSSPCCAPAAPSRITWCA